MMKKMFNIELIKKDFARWCEIQQISYSKRSFLRKFYSNREFRAVVYYRMRHASLVGRITQRLMQVFFPMQNNLYLTCKNIGAGLYIMHGYSTCVGATSIGENCWISQNVTIGNAGKYQPTIGNNVIIYPGAVIVGRVKIGNNAIIGANSFVINNVPDNAIISTMPAKDIDYRE